MRKLLLTALIAGLGFQSMNAQEAETSNTGKGYSQGDAMITGSIGFGNSKTGNFSSNNFEVAPRVGYFVSDNLAVGVGLGFGSSKTTQETFGTDIEVKNNSLSAGLFGRYYFTPANDFSVFTQLGFDYLSNKTEIPSGETKSNGFGAAFAPGINYFVSDHFALEASFGILSYSTLKPDADGAESTNTFNIGLDLSDINLGLVYKF